MLYSNPDIRTSQCSLTKPVHYSGTGFYSGLLLSMTLRPSPPNSGIHFLRTDVDFDQAVIAASWRNIIESPLGTVLGNEHGVTITAVEYLMAALRICGVDNVLIEVSGEEVPEMATGDISLVSLINGAGVSNQQEPRFGIWIEQPIEVRLAEQSALLNPSTRPTFTAEIDLLGINTIDTRYVSVPMLDHVFEQDIIPAPGSGPNDQLYRLREGHELVDNPFSSDDNLVDDPLVDFVDELPVHMILRNLGGLVLAEAPIFGHLFINGL
ncbi:MAG: UDP-3-O-acyl-N-acetylglucosamine deacetylase, partial [Gammaproteobacteria bacterium]|nr:UDP-3-O-acyl-N-acetylglucosamine deacetylase [Gammaproteobacteria bacterium]